MARSTLSIKRRALAAVAGGASLAIVLTACSGSGDGGDAGDTEAATADCSAYEEYGDLSGKTVSVYTTIVDTEAEQQQESYKPFEDCTGATIKYEGSKEFEAQLPIRIQSGSAPDIAYIPQPGFLKSLVQDYPDAILPVGDAASANVDEFYTESWRDYGTVDGTLYATPLGANVKSFVWYSPAMFEDAGYEIPTTWDELIALSDQIVEDNPDGEIKPWCAGIGSGEATGWPATDWMEDVVLRTAGPEVYDQWVNHEIPFNDPQIAEALATVGTVLKNDDYVNGGIGDVSSIATTEFTEGGLPILDGLCYMHRQASFYQANWPEGTTVAEDGDVFAFYFPGNDTEAKPVLGGGEFVVSFADRPEVQAFQAFLTSPEWSNAKATATPQGWISANKELDKSLLQSPIDQLSYGLLTDDSYVFRFDGSDMMPAAVGAGSFWTEMTEWIASDKSDTAVLDAIEASWPTS
ncbi:MULTISPECIES: ABC transporter substrate-binding protein [Oerskovia]|uniref:ABC transporter substrate-binding protein n=1 Tax=Oerskovia TaxID=162491 RepID=UPI0006FD87F5|nr:MULTISPECIES: ABC transporter substrate-binding protein [unclassified Oerskovia]KRC33072.1 sugar ABC transporter substrate-binding protein [Oerskovia sp. Root22]KRD35761.1 sugar ABC transporter substrate-binding protein [Oerskovia sp. Root918]